MKAQAAFLAPFVIYLFIRRRVEWRTWLVAPAVFVAAWFPALVAGWPLSYLATLYVGQFQWVDSAGDYFIGSGASCWVAFGYLAPQLAFETRWLGLPLMSATLAGYWRLLPKPTPRRIVPAAALSAAVVPFVLPLMLDRFFLLATILAFVHAAAHPNPRSIGAAVSMEIAAAMPIFVWAFRFQPWETVGFLFSGVAIALLSMELSPVKSRRAQLPRFRST